MLKQWEGTCNRYGTFLLHIGQVQFSERNGPVPVVIDRTTTVSRGVGCTLLHLGMALGSGGEVVRRVGVACTAASMLNDTPGLLALLDARSQEQPLKILLKSVEDAKDFISNWKINKDVVEVDVCPALTLDEVRAIRRLFQVEKADKFLTGDVVKVKLGQYEAIQAARNLPELPVSAVCAILAAAEKGKNKGAEENGGEKAADVGAQGQQKPSAYLSVMLLFSTWYSKVSIGINSK
ncbi:uncharacterized protein LOC127770855 [Oryza glaberrima]|uniref:uncharacterized protein LOC127770855 n=1 Tax=Oryza glaberrima TaxID=4538 RepID=UPI00224C52E9|nr:uncharacterized protein LOC127770855 [Oryza glaberrima]